MANPARLMPIPLEKSWPTPLVEKHKGLLGILLQALHFILQIGPQFLHLYTSRSAPSSSIFTPPDRHPVPPPLGLGLAPDPAPFTPRIGPSFVVVGLVVLVTLCNHHSFPAFLQKMVVGRAVAGLGLEVGAA